mgnify:CR=1 FL=1
MIEREKLQHLIENIGIPKLCLILLLGISLIIVSIPSGKTKKNAQSTETTAKEDSTDLYVKKQEKRIFGCCGRRLRQIHPASWSIRQKKRYRIWRAQRERFW